MIKDNLQDIEQIGLELGARFTPQRSLFAYLNYSLVLGREAGSGKRFGDWPRHLWSLGVEWYPSADWRLNLDANLVFDYRPVVMRLTGSRAGYPYISWDDIQAADQAIVDLKVGRFFAKQKGEVFLAIKNLAGFFRAPEGLRGYPSSIVQPFGGTVLLGIRLTGM
jgi:outer membrane receptor protein involved in Fe transport